MKVRTHISKNEYLQAVKFTNDFDDDDEGLRPFINLFDLLNYGSFTNYLREFINCYQHHIASHKSEDDDDDWVEAMVSEREDEIMSYARSANLNFIIFTTDLIEFTFIIMDLLYDAGVPEIYKRYVEDIRVGEYGQTTILFEEDTLQRYSLSTS